MDERRDDALVDGALDDERDGVPWLSGGSESRALASAIAFLLLCDQANLKIMAPRVQNLGLIGRLSPIRRLGMY